MYYLEISYFFPLKEDKLILRPTKLIINSLLSSRQYYVNFSAYLVF